MKTLFSISLMLLSMYVVAQNVGINNPNPQYPLDVQGNVNVAGNVLLNGNSGSNGQVIVSKGGNTTWAGIGDYKTVLSFTQGATFSVPVGVTEIFVEAWGGGGGGASGGGGAAGLYAYTTIQVTPGDFLNIIVGSGGAGNSTSPGNGITGTPTTVTKSGVTILNALAGTGGTVSSPGYGIRLGAAGGSYKQFVGEGGKTNKVSYQQKTSTLYTIITQYGEGGAAGPDYSRFCEGQTTTTNEANGALIYINYPSFSPFPASGGGGGVSGVRGADGYVVLHY